MPRKPTSHYNPLTKELEPCKMYGLTFAEYTYLMSRTHTQLMQSIANYKRTNAQLRAKIKRLEATTS